jgi:hypothetical protein
MIPSHPKSMIATTFEVRAPGAEWIQVKLTITPKGSSAPLWTREQACERDESTHTYGICTFLIFDSDVPRKMDHDVKAEVTGWGSCSSAGCAAPKTLTISSFTLK